MKKLIAQSALFLILGATLFSCSDLWGQFDNPVDSHGTMLPSDLVAVAGNGQVGLSWKSVSGANAYSIYRSTVSDSKGNKIGSTENPQYTDMWLMNGVTYYYEVTATIGSIESAASSQVPAVPQSVEVPLTYDFSWGDAGTADGQFGKNEYGDGGPRSIAIDSKGYVYVADSLNNRIQKFDAQGNFILQWGAQESEPDQFISVDRLFVDRNDRIYAVDCVNNRIGIFSDTGSFITQLKGQGISGSGQFNLYGGYGGGGVAVDSEGSLYVMDTSNYRIVKFSTSDGVNYTFAREWGSRGTGIGQFDWGYCRNIVIDANDCIYVPDMNRRIQKFDKNGKPVLSFDCSMCEQDIRVAIDRAADILYVLDVSNCCIHGFYLEGSYIGKWEGRGSMNYPSSFACGKGFMYILDFNNVAVTTSNNRVSRLSIVR